MPLLLINAVAFLVVTLGVIGLWYWMADVADPDRKKALARLRGLNSAPAPLLAPAARTDWTRPLVRWLGSLGGTLGVQPTELRTRLMHAGFTGPSAPAVFLGVKTLIAVLLAAGGVALMAWLGPKLLPRTPAWLRPLIGSLGGLNVGLLAVEWWLSARVEGRKNRLRNALPDDLDMLVLCLEGGVTFNAALQRVTDQMSPVHPALAAELTIVGQEILLGLTAGEALRKFAERCGLSDVRDLAMVIVQSERYGATLGKTLRMYADNTRHDRQMRAEEMAQKAAVKIVFPTLLCIFPAIFIVLLGPAAIKLSTLFAK